MYAYLCVCVCVRERESVCVCVCTNGIKTSRCPSHGRQPIHLSKHMYVRVHAYVYVCVHVYVHVCACVLRYTVRDLGVGVGIFEFLRLLGSG